MTLQSFTSNLRCILPPATAKPLAVPGRINIRNSQEIGLNKNTTATNIGETNEKPTLFAFSSRQPFPHTTHFLILKFSGWKNWRSQKAKEIVISGPKKNGREDMAAIHI